MNTFRTALSFAIQSFQEDLDEMKQKNKEKQREAIDLYNLAKQMPRKKKKQMKIKAEKEYNFWKSLEIWQNSTFPL